jgi:F0F1-type ATP synthase membrane subunit b/b'
MFMQDNDPHHMHPDPNSIYYFVILAVILVAMVFFVGTKIMKYLDNRYERKKPSKKDSKTESEDARDG